jgi:hypothetical protein
VRTSMKGQDRLENGMTKVSETLGPRPDLLKEWDQENAIDPNKAKLHPRTKVIWRCSTDPAHRWEASIRARAQGKGGCPFCWEAPVSEIAMQLAEILLQHFRFDPQVHKIPKAGGLGAHDVDILIPSPFGGKSLVIEYDSHYRHRCKDDQCRHLTTCRHNKDRHKTSGLKRLGYVVIRVRELPLDAVCGSHRHHRRDLHVPNGSTASKIASTLIPHIFSVYGRDTFPR